MSKRKTEDLKKLNAEQIGKKLAELRFELIKSKVSSSKTGNAKPKEIRKTIARLLTFNKK